MTAPLPQAPTEMTFEPFAEISKDLQFIKKEEKKEADARVLWDTKTEVRTLALGTWAR